MARRLTITLAARAVIARGFAFSPREGSFADVDVVLDEILSLPPPPEPLVLRVTATGGDAAERARVEGDWLCDAALGEPRRLPAPAWVYSEDATAWAQARPWLEAWETCQDARWMLHAAASVGVDRRLVVRAACACARTVLNRIPEGEERPRRAIEAAEAWSYGQVPLDAVRQASVAAYAASIDPVSVHAVVAAADAADAASDAVYAHAAAATAVAYYVATARRRALARLAALVRIEIPTLTVLQAVAGAR